MICRLFHTDMYLLGYNNARYSAGREHILTASLPPVKVFDARGRSRLVLMIDLDMNHHSTDKTLHPGAILISVI